MPASVETAVDKLHRSLEAIRFRDGVKPQEATRIQEAFILLSEPQGTAETKTQERRECYRELLKTLHRAVGLQAVVLCAVGLGQSAVANMRERLKIDFVSAVKAQKEALSCAILEKLVEEYAAKVSLSQNAQQSEFDQQPQWTEGQRQVTDSLTGDVYRLTIQDAQAITVSDQIRGTILLTNTYNAHSSPFITIPISRELSDQLATQRLQMM
ncbi:hypothetical protein MMC13_001807 [Lambiella insularis]|nr:hypothetical protein [Lambiella insularis]